VLEVRGRLDARTLTSGNHGRSGRLGAGGLELRRDLEHHVLSAVRAAELNPYGKAGVVPMER
jgi:hypothetical protein